jgi:hypothetical protein
MIALAACDRSAPPPVGSAAPVATPPMPVATSPVPAASASASPERSGGESKVTFDADPVGAPSPSFEAVVGDWYVAEENGARGLKVDGSKWRNGTPSANLADQAKRLYGERYAEFLDGVKAFAFFPLAVSSGMPPSGDVRIQVRFYPEAGRIDQGAGIAFGIAEDGSYLGARANALEDNMLFFKVVKGRRSIIDTIRNVTTSTHAWHTLAVELRGPELTVELDGARKFKKTLDGKPAGRVGLWSKADSQVLFDDFTVTPL